MAFSVSSSCNPGVVTGAIVSPSAWSSVQLDRLPVIEAALVNFLGVSAADAAAAVATMSSIALLGASPDEEIEMFGMNITRGDAVFAVLGPFLGFSRRRMSEGAHFDALKRFMPRKMRNARRLEESTPLTDEPLLKQTKYALDLSGDNSFVTAYWKDDWAVEQVQALLGFMPILTIIVETAEVNIIVSDASKITGLQGLYAALGTLPWPAGDYGSRIKSDMKVIDDSFCAA